MSVLMQFHAVTSTDVFKISTSVKPLAKNLAVLAGFIFFAALLPGSGFASPSSPIQPANPSTSAPNRTDPMDPQDLKATLMAYCAAGKLMDERLGNQVESALGPDGRKRFETFMAAKSAKSRHPVRLSSPSLCGAESSPIWAFSKEYAFVPDLVAASQEEADAHAEPDLKALKFHGRELHFLGVTHISMIRSGSEALIDKTLAAINDQLQSFKPDLVIVEGLEAGLGVDSCKAAVHVLWFSDAETNISLGEPKLVVRYAAQNGIEFQGGEPSVAELQELVNSPKELAKMKYRYPKFTASDIADFDAFVRFAAQARQASPAERKEMANGQQAAALAVFFQKFEKKSLSDEDLATLYDRYTETTSTTEGPGLESLFSFHLEARDARLRKAVCNGLDSHTKVLVIFGKYHLKTNWPCLSAWTSK